MSNTTNTTTPKLPRTIAVAEYFELGRAGLEAKYGIIIVAIRDGIHGLEIQIERRRPEEDEHAKETE